MRQLLFLTGWLVAAGLAWDAGAAQPPTPGSGSQKLSPPPPPVPAVVSPMQFFRQLLAMAPAERETALVGRPAQDKQVILDKLREFEALPPGRREARLQALQRQLDFRTLIKLPETNRLERLNQLAVEDRQYLSERLRQWDQVAPEIRTAVLTNLILLRFMFPDSNFQRPPSSSPYQRALLATAIDKWNNLPEQTKALIESYFKEFFTLDEKQQAKTLKPLSETERAQMQRCLSVFEKMPQQQKAKCISGFEKFASLTTQERQEFLQSAEQWEKMTPGEREVWRSLVLKYRMPRPPMPPGMIPMPPPPPIPATIGLGKPLPVGLVNTN